MAKPISRKELLTVLLPGLNALFGSQYPGYVIKKHKGKYALIETNHVEETIIAKDLTKKEASILFNLITGVNP